MACSGYFRSSLRYSGNADCICHDTITNTDHVVRQLEHHNCAGHVSGQRNRHVRTSMLPASRPDSRSAPSRLCRTACAEIRANHEPAECGGVPYSVHRPAVGDGGDLERIACGWHLSSSWSGEEVQVLGGQGREVLSNEGCASREQEPVADGQTEEQLCHLDLERCQSVGGSGWCPIGGL